VKVKNEWRWTVLSSWEIIRLQTCWLVVIMTKKLNKKEVKEKKYFQNKEANNILNNL